MRIGHGYDAHRFEAGRPLVIGGVTIPHSHGLAAHSDGDVLIHALCDALLGAIGAGDIGRHFPDTDPAYRGVASISLLRQVMAWVRHDEFQLNNLDATIVAQGPKLAPFLTDMREKLAEALEANIKQVNVKATTTEKMGFCGREEGMAAYAVVSIVSI